ncbi:hypothetical protein O181_055268 [Austropuccinia psidii MF-1]|uniref:Uncharacterized protein n=1 Tax=Austropuccinia psidii MF-1 TaxID=1389203 RepID=A0A9Q3E7K3_9BASI|nr:hypothetical protein [Austropuccinia psidii MF-1]
MRDRLIRLGYSWPLSTLKVPQRSREASVLSDSSSSTEFSSSSESSSPGPLGVVLGIPGKETNTPYNELDLHGPLPSSLDGAAPSIFCPLSKWALS